MKFEFDINEINVIGRKVVESEKEIRFLIFLMFVLIIVASLGCIESKKSPAVNVTETTTPEPMAVGNVTDFKPPFDLRWKYESSYFHTIDILYENGTLYQFGVPPIPNDNLTVRAFDKAGKMKWQRGGIAAISNSFGMTGDELVALDMETGTELWREKLGIGGEYSLVVDNGTAYVGASEGIVAYDIRDRTVKWKFNFGRELTGSSGVNLEKKGDILYASINTFKISIDKAETPPKIVALNAVNGTLLWVQEIGAFEIASLPPAPTVGRDKLYILTLASKTVYALDRLNGSIIWKSAVPIRDTTANHLLKIPLYEDKLYGTELRNEQVYALDANTGKAVWNTNISETVTIQNLPVVYDDVVYVGVEESGRSHDLYAFDANDGKLIWTYATKKKWTLTGGNPTSFNFLVIGDDMLFAVMEKGDVYAFSPRSSKTAGFEAVLGLFGLFAIIAYKERRKLK